MAPQKVTTIMVLKVNLDCPCCYTKVKKLLCQFPQIRDQIYNEKQNTVTIRVWCCSPGKIRDKLCCKGGKSIKSIEIVEPVKPAPQPAKPPEPAPEPKQEPPKQAPEPKPEPQPIPVPIPTPVQQPEPVQCYPVYPVNTCCSECYEGHTTGPCYRGFGNGYGIPPRPPPPAPVGRWCCYDDGCPPAPPPGGYGYNYKPGYCISRCGDYISDENPTACLIM